jgi:hypothetical protein
MPAMNARIRAYRILRPMQCFKYASEGIAPLEGVDAALGELIGHYENTVPADGVIAIFMNGTAWTTGTKVHNVLYVDIVGTEFPDGKRLPGLILKTRQGEEFMLPVMGQRGRFLDSMEMARFLKRAVEDVNNSCEVGSNNR